MDIDPDGRRAARARVSRGGRFCLSDTGEETSLKVIIQVGSHHPMTQVLIGPFLS